MTIGVVIGVLSVLILGLIAAVIWLLWMSTEAATVERHQARLLLLDLKEIMDHVTTEAELVAAVHALYARWAESLGLDTYPDA